MHLSVKTVKETQVTGLALTLSLSCGPNTWGLWFFCLFFFYPPAKQIPQDWTLGHHNPHADPNTHVVPRPLTKICGYWWRTWTKVHHVLDDQHSLRLSFLSETCVLSLPASPPQKFSLTLNIVKEKTNIGNFSCGCEKKSCSGLPSNMLLHSFNREKEIKIKQTYV